MEVIVLDNRLKQLRRALNMTQDEFSKKIGLARNSVANYEIGRREPTNSIIVSICREFDVNEEWLRTGQGEMFADIPQEDEYFKAATQISKNGDDLIMSMIVEYWKLDESSKETFRKYIRSVAGSIKKEQD